MKTMLSRFFKHCLWQGYFRFITTAITMGLRDKMSFIKIGLIILCSFLSMATFARVQCSNFATQEEAQRYYERNGATWLDRDRDGEACECLPGGSKYGSSKCRNY